MTGCPACGASAEKLATKIHRGVIRVPHGTPESYDEAVDTCGTCGESGDFRGVNEEPFKAARARAVRSSIPSMLALLAGKGWTKTYIERVMSLPFGTLRGWESTGEVSPEGVAFLRLLVACPGLLQIADESDGGMFGVRFEASPSPEG